MLKIFENVFFQLHHLILLNQQEQLSTSKPSTLLFKQFKPLGTFSNLSISDFKLANSTFLANCNVSILIAFFKSDSVA